MNIRQFFLTVRYGGGFLIVCLGFLIGGLGGLIAVMGEVLIDFGHWIASRDRTKEDK